ncbi:MAG: phytanoyl-CoA dioxygenase family protein [Pseudomonadota bacterium]|nr:phytanoyl-CoA dioxygenase family protein [Pseudomonadota bacterium]
MRLEQEQIDAFFENGFVLADGFLDLDELDHLRACYMETIDRLKREQVLENVQSGSDRDEEFQVYQIRTAHLRHPVFRMLINDSRLLDMVESLIGPDIRLIHYQGIYKPAYTGGEVRWHQDNDYFKVAENRTISVWLALDDVTVENGCMWYLPGHHHQLLEHEQLWSTSEKKGFYLAIPEIDDTRALPAEIKSGGFAIHHCLMPHRSLKNETARPRRGLAMHFMDAKMPDPDMLSILPEDATPVLRRRS